MYIESSIFFILLFFISILLIFCHYNTINRNSKSIHYASEFKATKNNLKALLYTTLLPLLFFYLLFIYFGIYIYCLCFITNNIHKDMLRPYYWDDVIPIFAVFDLHIYLDKLMKLIVILSLLLLLLFVVPYLVRFIYYNDLLFKIIFWIRLVCIGIFFFFMSSKMSYRIG